MTRSAENFIRRKTSSGGKLHPAKKSSGGEITTDRMH
jgi:hypothetical protein